MTGTATILRGNALELPLADASVDLIVTSPPYFGLRSYQDGGEHYEGQIGSEATPAQFVDALLAATAEMVRVLKPSGSLWVNLGDKYAATSVSSNWATMPLDHDPEKKMLQRLDASQAGGPKLRPGVPTKSLIGIPWRYAIACIDQLGLILRAEVIWAKPNGLPESVTDRVRRSHEQWFHLVKQPRYFSAIDEIREEQASNGHRHEGRSGYVNAAGKAGGEGVARGFTERALNPLGKLPGSVWQIPTQPLTVPPELGVDHFAAFPMEWPRRIIQGWSPSGVCTACGEGRRPVAISERMSSEGLRPVYGAGNHGTGGSTLGPRGVVATITGYACACTPYTDHPGTRGPVGTVRFGAGAALKDGAQRSDEGRYAPREGVPWREYHFDQWTPPPTTPAVVLDPFGGTGTVALVAKALGRHGISLDMSADYCRLAGWRTTDEGEYARALQVEKPAKQVDGQLSLLEAWA